MSRKTFYIIIYIVATIVVTACSSNWDDKYANTPFKSGVASSPSRGRLIAEKDWTGVKDEELPWIEFADLANGSAKGGADGIEITVTKVVEIWQPQALVLEGFDLAKDGNYLVVVTAKLPCDGQMQINMGNWEKNYQYDFPVYATGNFQEIECEFSKYENNAKDAHVLFQCGNFVGTSIVKKVQVIQLN